MSNPVAWSARCCDESSWRDCLRQKSKWILFHGSYCPVVLREMACMESLTPLETFCMVLGKFCWK